jgi:RNA polymerase sigma factor (sigma-70 family)
VTLAEMRNETADPAKRRIGSRWRKASRTCSRHGHSPTVSSPAANSATYASPCLIAPEADAQWFRENIRPHERELRAYLRGRFPTLPDVDDLVQETYARILRAREGGRATLTRAYLFVVARNVALDLIRREKTISVERLGEMERLNVVQEGPDAAEALSHDQELALLDAAMRALPPRCREILTLRRIEGLSHRAIAEKLGIAEGTVNAQLAIGLMRCRQFLCAHGVARACIKSAEGANSHGH